MTEKLHSAQKSYHPAVVSVLKWFECGHLPAPLQDVVKPFAALAQEVASRGTNSPETTVALRKLLEAKDAAVRAALDEPRPAPGSAVKA